MHLMTEQLAELLHQEGLHPVKELVPDKPSQTIWNWIKKGVRGVRLEAVQKGRFWETSQAAYARFLARLTNQRIHTPTESVSTKAKRAAKASASLKKMKPRKG